MAGLRLRRKNACQKQRISKRKMTHKKILHYIKLLEHNHFYSILHSENANWSHIVYTIQIYGTIGRVKFYVKYVLSKKKNEGNVLFNFQLYYRFLSKSFHVKRIHDLIN